MRPSIDRDGDGAEPRAGDDHQGLRTAVKSASWRERASRGPEMSSGARRKTYLTPCSAATPRMRRRERSGRRWCRGVLLPEPAARDGVVVDREVWPPSACRGTHGTGSRVVVPRELSAGVKNGFVEEGRPYEVLGQRRHLPHGRSRRSPAQPPTSTGTPCAGGSRGTPNKEDAALPPRGCPAPSRRCGEHREGEKRISLAPPGSRETGKHRPGAETGEQEPWA
jgi:hypothetical protein